MTTYKKEVKEKYIHDRMITLTNLTPEFSVNERKEKKKSIEIKLYDVFCRYI